MADNFLGEIRPVPYNFAPRGWALCSGQILPINQNTALFSLIGTFYGGNGTSNFALPDLQGRIPVGMGQGPGLSSVNIGDKAGVENVTLVESQMAPHTHVLGASSTPADTVVAAGNIPAVSARQVYGTGSVTPMSATAIGASGGGQPHDNIQPSLGLTYIIALTGIFPARG